MSEKQTYTRISVKNCVEWGTKGHTGVGLVSRSGRLLTAKLSLHFPRTTSAYTLDLGRPEV